MQWVYKTTIAMANKRNKKNRKLSAHRHVFIKKKLPGKCRSVSQQKRKSSPTLQLQGSRIVNVENLQQYTTDLHHHSTVCEGSVSISTESRDGLTSVIGGECSTCKQTVTLETSKKVKGPRGYNR